ncbi:Hypothetical predicted protein [Octopus vulgaris]|uniref:Sex-determining region Y protein n=1 Tax=Octopus vulgaris TaxID=6645 RepID=A0AA36ARR9_OCTVU|nr:Hypothetical predicted protein [Octopus vulgaris]
MDNIHLLEVQSPQLSFENSHVKAPGEITKSSHMFFPMQLTNENFYKHTFVINSIENFEKYDTKECLSSHQTDDSPLTVIKHVKEEYFPNDVIEKDISKTFSKHQLISGAEFTNLKRKYSNTNQSFLYTGSSKISSDFIKGNQNSSKKILVSPHPFEIKEESEKYDVNNLQPLFNDVLMKKFHSPIQNLHSQSGAGLINTTESPYQQTNSVDLPNSHKSFQQQGTPSLCHQFTKESSRKPQKENVKPLTEIKLEEILDNCWNVPIDENQELGNLELQNLITKLREYLPKNDLLHKPTLEDVVIATANYALELDMMIQKDNDKTSCNGETRSSCQKNCSSNIKRPQNGFIRFSVEKRAEVAAKNPHLDNRNISCVLGSQWKLLSKENREHYQRKFETEMKDLRKKHPDWMYSNKKSDVDVILEVMPTRLRPAEKRKKKVLDIFDDIPTKKKIMSKKRTSKRIPRCKENVKESEDTLEKQRKFKIGEIN